jgi:hypothetical protein
MSIHTRCYAWASDCLTVELFEDGSVGFAAKVDGKTQYYPANRQAMREMMQDWLDRNDDITENDAGVDSLRVIVSLDNDTIGKLTKSCNCKCVPARGRLGPL